MLNFKNHLRFEEDDSVLFISLHRYENGRFYPSNAASNYTDVGRKQGKGLENLYNKILKLFSGGSTITGVDCELIYMFTKNYSKNIFPKTKQTPIKLNETIF